MRQRPLPLPFADVERLLVARVDVEVDVVTEAVGDLGTDD
jgi:hypothetical protein